MNCRVACFLVFFFLYSVYKDLSRSLFLFEAPFTIGLKETVFWKTHLLCRLQILLILFTVLQEFARPKRQSSGLEVEANLSFED